MEMGDDQPSDGNGTPKKINLEPCGRWMLLRGFEYLFHMSSLCILPGMRIPHLYIYIHSLKPVAGSPCFFHGFLKMVGTRGSLWASRAKAAMVCSFWSHFGLVLYWEVLGTISPSWVVGVVFGCKAWSSIALILGVDIALAHWAGLTFA